MASSSEESQSTLSTEILWPTNMGRMSKIEKDAESSNTVEKDQSIEMIRERFQFQLSKEEIEIDFTKLTGLPPPPNPKRRPSSAQQYLDKLVPGSKFEDPNSAMSKTHKTNKTNKDT